MIGRRRESAKSFYGVGVHSFSRTLLLLHWSGPLSYIVFHGYDEPPSSSHSKPVPYSSLISLPLPLAAGYERAMQGCLKYSIIATQLGYPCLMACQSTLTCHILSGRLLQELGYRTLQK
jgi:hypothetical protein